MIELLTAEEVATLLRLSKWQVYELAKERSRTGDMREFPLPSLRIGKAVRFNRQAVENWIERLQG